MKSLKYEIEEVKCPRHVGASELKVGNTEYTATIYDGEEKTVFNTIKKLSGFKSREEAKKEVEECIEEMVK